MTVNDPPLVSVVMPTYNCGAYIAEAIDSALGQTYPSIEVIVCDDGSTDDTASVLARYEGRIRVIPGEHRGVSAARNKILRVARGPFIAFLDADDIWPLEKLERQMAVMIGRPEVTLCQTGSAMFGGQTGDGPIVDARRRRIQGDCFRAQFEQTGIQPTSTIIRRADMPAHGFYEDMPVAEDYALFLEMLWGREAAYLPEVTTRIRRRADQATADDGKRLQVYNGLARLRALDYLAPNMPEAEARELRRWALDELRTCAYSRYWQGDFRVADRAFEWLAHYGEAIALRHRLRARLQAPFSDKLRARRPRMDVPRTPLGSAQ